MGGERLGGNFRVAVMKVGDIGLKTAVLPECVGAMTGKSGIVARSFAIVDDMFPNFQELRRSWLWNEKRLPFAARKIDLINFGAEQNAYKVEDVNGRTFCVKVMKETQAMNPKEMRLLAERYSSEYDWHQEVFQSVPGLILPESPLILHSVMRSRPALAVVQPFVCEATCLFCLSETEVDKLKTQESVVDAVRRFAQIVTGLYEEEDLMVDLNGRSNIVVGDCGGEYGMYMLDPHAVFTAEERRTGGFVRLMNRDWQKEFESQLERLNSFAHNLAN